MGGGGWKVVAPKLYTLIAAHPLNVTTTLPQLYANLLIINSTPPSPLDCFSFTYITTGLLHETNYYILKFEDAYISINMLISYDFNIHNNNNNKAYDNYDRVILLVNYMCRCSLPQLRDGVTQHVLNHYLLG
jgi:hypothetical protein